MKNRFTPLLAAVVLPIALCTPAFAASHKSTEAGISSHPGMVLSHKHRGDVTGTTDSTSSNWSGYALTGKNGSYNSVSSSWVQPAVDCSGVTKATYSAYWIGLDGFSDSTVEQIGTEADCSHTTPVYGAWYEMYPSNPYEVGVTLTIHPGDQMSAAVNYNPSVTTSTVVRGHTRYATTKASYTLALRDITTSKSYSVTITPRQSYARSSAEVVTEAPYSGGVLPLANYGTVNYMNTLVNGQPMGGQPNLQAVTMQNPAGMVSTPSVFDSTDEDFSTTWSAS